MTTYEVARRHPDGHTITERIDAASVTHEDQHIVFFDQGVLLSIHQNHCISVRNIDTLGEEPAIAFPLGFDPLDEEPAT